MTLTDFANNFWILVPLGLALFIIVMLVNGGPYKSDPPKGPPPLM